MELNILKIVLDRAGRITNSQNLSLNQCSSNNRLKVYYEGEYDYIECSFRKPDGWLSDKIGLILDVDEELYNYAYVDIPEDFVTFPMGGRNAILVGNLYLHKGGVVASLGNIRINVNYVDDSLVHTNYSENYMANINSQIGALQNDLNRFKTGDVLVGKAISDRKGNTIDIYYETKADALDKYDDLNQKKLDKSEVQDQTDRLDMIETANTIASGRLTQIEKELTTQDNQIDLNTSDIQDIRNTTVSNTNFEKIIQERIEAEQKLQKQIDDVAASSNVKDIVGSFADLSIYENNNKDNLEVGDRIQVISDASKNNLPSIYRWTGSGWEHIGTYSSASYSKTEINDKLDSLRAVVPNKIKTENNTIYLYKDGVKIEDQSNPITFKTINGKSILGTGNLSTDNTDAAFSSTSTNPVQNKVITAALSNKADNSIVEALRTVVDTKASNDDLTKKQDKLTAGANVKIEDGVISVSSAIKFSKVDDELPEIGETNIIYLLKTTENAYTEYIWVDGKWEALGDAQVSLDNYYTQSEINEMVAVKANQSDLTSLETRVSSNTSAIAGKADAATTSTSITSLNNSVATLNSSIANKVDSEVLKDYALKEEIPDVSVKQDKLVSGQNIKTINGINILGPGDLLIADTEIVDLGNYVLKTENQAALDLKADKTELFDKDYNSLNNRPRLDLYATKEELEKLEAAIPDMEVNNYYTKAETYNKTEIDTAIANVDVSDQLKDYAKVEDVYTKSEVDTALENVSVDLTGYATEQWVEDKGYMKTIEAAGLFAVKSDIPTVPINISAFANDKNYIKIEDAQEYTDAEIDKVEATISTLIGNAPEAYDTLKEIADYITSDKSAAASMLASINKNAEDISKQGSQISSLDGSVYKKTEIDSKLSTINSSLSTKANSSEVYTKTEVDTKLTENLNSAKTHSNTNFENAKAYTDEKIQDFVELELDTRISEVEEEIERLDGDIKNITEDELPGIKQELDNVYTKTEIDDKQFLQFDNTISKANAVVDFNNNKELKFSSNTDTTEFVIENVEVDSILQLLSMIVPNEY